MDVDPGIVATDLVPATNEVFALAADKVCGLHDSWDPATGTPVFTRRGRYTQRGWTEWTRGFQYGCALLAFDGGGARGGGVGDGRSRRDPGELLRLGLDQTNAHMAPHLTHSGVHDHGFNTMSTHGTLLRLALEGAWSAGAAEVQGCRLAICVSGAVQAGRWTELPDGLGYVYSFNGPHSLFVDTIRSMRVLACAHDLGHYAMSEGDRPVSLARRALQHAAATARYNIYYGRERDRYDVAGRVAHESIFNVNDGAYRCPSTQQGYSPFSTWTRGLAWAVLGFAELAEWLLWLPEQTVVEAAVPGIGSVVEARELMIDAARTTAGFYLANSASDGVTYWDTGAPGLAELGDWRQRPAEPDNPVEPVDSSAAAIAAQGLLRLGRMVDGPYTQAGLTAARTLFSDRYLAYEQDHQGLLLHVVYHHPNGWDYVPEGGSVPHGESCLWGDYHLLELALLVQRLGRGGDVKWMASRAAPEDRGQDHRS